MIIKFLSDHSSDPASDQELARAMTHVPVLLQARIDGSEPRSNVLAHRFMLAGEARITAILGANGWIPIELFSEIANDVCFVDATSGAISMIDTYRGSPVKSLSLCALKLASGTRASFSKNGALTVTHPCTNPVVVAGVGMIKFAKPGPSASYVEMGADATRLALADAGIDYADVQQAYAGHVYGDSTCGQRVLYEVGMTGVPIVNVNNNCATGSTALFLAHQAVASGMADCALAVGFEQMQPGPIVEHWTDRASTFERFNEVTDALVDDQLPLVLRYFVGVGREHMQRYGTSLRTFAEVRAKASRHAARNPMALFREEVTADDVLRAQVIAQGVMTRPMACPPTCGAAAAVIVSPEFARRRGIRTDVRILSQALVSDRAPTFESGSMISLLGAGTNREAAQRVYEEAGVGPEEVDVCELHDCFAQAEVVTYEALGFCPEGSAEKFVSDGDNTYGGKVVINPSGGLLSKGHPLGATGLAQCYELTHQLRGTAGARQVEGARFALQHNLGLGSAAVVALYGRA